MNAERDEVCTARSSEGVSPPLSPVGFLRLAIILPADLRGQTPVAKTEDTSLCPRKRARACLQSADKFACACLCGPPIICCLTQQTWSICTDCTNRSALIDDELILKCKYWKIEMVYAPTKPKEKPDAAVIRQEAIRQRIKAAEDKYNQQLREQQVVMQDWFFHGAEKKVLSGL